MHFIFCIFVLYVALFRETDAQFSDSGKKKILDRHNDFRSEVARGVYKINETVKPPASNMQKLVWDPTLAEAAQTYAEKRLGMVHSTNRKGVGENIFRAFSWFQTLDNNAERSVIDWMHEFQEVGWKSNKLDRAFVELAGHATQIVWATTNKLGCGGVLDGFTVYIVCQYAPQGNYLNANIYEIGETCSECPAGTRCEETSGLCANETLVDTNPEPATNKTCDLGWQQFERNCYMQSPLLKWAEAEEWCYNAHEGSHITSLHSKEQAKFIADTYSNVHFKGFLVTWVGLRADCNNTWIWSDGSEYDFEFWRAGNPSGNLQKRCSTIWVTPTVSPDPSYLPGQIDNISDCIEWSVNATCKYSLDHNGPHERFVVPKCNES